MRKNLDFSHLIFFDLFQDLLLRPGVLLALTRRNWLLTIVRLLSPERRLAPGIVGLLSHSSMFCSGFTIILNVPPDVEGNQNNCDYNDETIQVVQGTADFVVVVAQLITQEGQQVAPGQRSDKRVHAELHKRHPCNASRQRDECAYYWQ
jgi:hypothetical protein